MPKKPQEEMVLVDLSDEERAQRAFELAEVSRDLRLLKEEKAEYNRRMKAQIDDLEKRSVDLAEACMTGTERRPAQIDAFPANGRDFTLPRSDSQFS